MKSELRLEPHGVLFGEQVVEVWHDGAMIGVVYGADGPGIRFVSKHMSTAQISQPDPVITEIVLKP